MARQLYDLCGIDEELRFSPYCWRAKYALAHKGLDYETLPWCFTDKEAIAFSDQGKVPVLVDGDDVVVDSFDILRYLDRRYPQAPLLGDALGEERAGFFKFYAERSLAPAILRIVILDLARVVHPKDRDYFYRSREKALGCSLEEFHDPQKGAAMLDAALTPLRARLEEADFLDGDTPAAADYIVFGPFMWAHCVSTADLVAEGDPVRAWQERMLDLHGGLGRKARRSTDIAQD